MSKKRAAKRPPKPTNKEIVVSIAVSVLQGKGIIEEPEDDVLSALERLYEQHPAFQVEVKFTDRANASRWHTNRSSKNSGSATKRHAGVAHVV